MIKEIKEFGIRILISEATPTVADPAGARPNLIAVMDKFDRAVVVKIDHNGRILD